MVVPTVAVTVRRLHDAGYSGWLYPLTLIPYLGSFIVMIFCILPSSVAGARFDRGAPPPWSYGPYGQPGPYGQSPSGQPNPYGQPPSGS